VRADGLFAPQVPVRPVPVSALQYEKPEWSGHRESSPAARPTIPRREPLVSDQADVVIVGAGVTGVSAALYAAKSGARTICLDRGFANAEASGGNAGSLHLQLLSWDFGDRAAGDGSAALATLVLQQESIELWRTLEKQTNSDFEMQLTGGMMVAESASQIEFLERKVRAENSVGIVSQVIDSARMRQIMPAIADCMVAAAWCPGEGKINPLIATPALVQAAKAHGAVIEEQAPVTAISRTGSGYTIQTPVGMVRTPRIIIAAGGWSAQVGAMLGVRIPVHGAPLQMIVTEPAPALVPCLLAHADRHLTLKQARAGSLIIGGAWTAETSPAGQSRVLAESLEGNLWVAAHTVPRLSDLHVLRSWAAMNVDIDGAPLLGRLPGQPRVVVAATANGYTLGPIMGREAAAMALQDSVPLKLHRFGFDRFHSP
jgi:glycine/D-amino acid oxidase-like deaminating enzyme